MYGDNGIQTGWMIENKINGYPMWWTGCHNIAGINEWDIESLNCVRFCRKEDAEMVIVGVLGLKIPSENILATDHQWG